MTSLFVRLLSVITTIIVSVPAHSAQTIWQQDSSYIATKQISGIAPSNHPITLDTKKLGRILSQLSVSTETDNVVISMIGDSESKGKRIFNDREIHLLAEGIGKALETSKNDEAVIYSMTGLKPAFFGTKSLSVSGTVYIKENKLNLIFGEVLVDLHKKYVRSGASVSNSRFASKPELSRFKLNTGSVTEESEHDWELELFPGAVRKNNRHDWIEVDLSHNYDYRGETNSTNNNGHEYLSDKQKRTTAKNIEQRLKHLEERQLSVKPNTSGPSITDRLRTLKSVFEEGSITEEVYLEKMRMIVDEI